MDAKYDIDDTDTIHSPAMILFRDLVESNLDAMIDIAGSAERLRPHCKTHKMAEVAKLEIARGIVKHKAATFAEAEMLADAGAEDVVLSYNVVGPNIARAIQFRRQFPDVRFAVTADHAGPIDALGEAMREANESIEVLLDVDCGMHRTGIAIGDAAADLYQMLEDTVGVEPGGLHVYDGHNHQESFDERLAAVQSIWSDVTAFRERLFDADLSVPRVVAGGTPTFNCWATIEDDDLELSPGTCVLHDCGYGSRYVEQPFTPAALLLTRVVSRPSDDTLTLDLGNKSVAADPPAGTRLHFPDLPDAEEVRHNEEHLVLRTPRAIEFQPGDTLLAIPRHVCPTSAAHRSVWVVSGGTVIGKWDVTARDRKLTI